MSAAPAPGSRRILLIEDHASLARLLRIILEGEGYAVTAVPTCGEALAAAEAAPFDAIVSDLTLPDGNACEHLGPLLQRVGGRAVALSGLCGGEHVARSQAAGFAEHLVKPVEADELLAAMRRVLGAG